MHKPPLTQRAHQLILEHVKQCSLTPKFALDATCGNGSDTIFLANLVRDKVFAFDIQKRAVLATRERLDHITNFVESKFNPAKVHLIQASHAYLSDYVMESVDVIMFNLGYLPGGDKSIVTQKQTTLLALAEALDLLNYCGLLSILCYSGHADGKEETLAVMDWLHTLPDTWRVKEYIANFPHKKSPILFHVCRQNLEPLKLEPL